MKTTLHSNETALVVEYHQEGDEYEAIINGQQLRARLLSFRNGALTLLVNEKPLHVHVASDDRRILIAIAGQVYEFTQAQEKQSKARRSDLGKLDPEVRSPMPGKILQVLVKEGMQVEAGQTLVLLEAMKMENSLLAGGAAQIKKVHVSPGDLVDLGQLVLELEFTTGTTPTVQDK
ncbi:MAG: biotin/lipoyl-containing protein [Candidatus Binatia bacterium]